MSLLGIILVIVILMILFGGNTFGKTAINPQVLPILNLVLVAILIVLLLRLLGVAL